MNLYRSFGNLMEAWVNEGGPEPEPPADPGPNFRSESVDSGVETASTDTALDSFSPVLSSPLPPSSPSSPPSSPTALQLKVEQALQRTDSRRQEPSGGLPRAEEALRRQERPQASSLQTPSRFSSGSDRGQRSGSFGQRRTAQQSASLRLTSDRRPVSLVFEKAKELSEEDLTGLSPGLCYLEQVCQMLENIAKQQLENRALRTETEAPREPQDAPESQEADSCHPVADDITSCHSLENIDDDKLGAMESQAITAKPYGHFRQRSASDTTLSTLHLRQVHSYSRGQYLSRDVLHERIEEEYVKAPKKGGSLNIDRHWRRILPSLRKEEGSVKDTKSQQQAQQPSEKNSARRRLSQLFRRRRKTLPV